MPPRYESFHSAAASASHSPSEPPALQLADSKMNGDEGRTIIRRGDPIDERAAEIPDAVDDGLFDDVLGQSGMQAGVAYQDVVAGLQREGGRGGIDRVEEWTRPARVL